MPPFTDICDVAIAYLTPSGRNLMARQSLGIVSLQLEGFSVGRGGYTPANPVHISPITWNTEAQQTFQINAGNVFSAGDTVIVNGVSFEVDPTGSGLKDWDAGADRDASSVNLVKAINISQNTNVINKIRASYSTPWITLKALCFGGSGNLFTLSKIDPSSHFALSGIVLVGGVDETLADQIFPTLPSNTIIEILKNDFETDDAIFANILFQVDPTAQGLSDWDAGIYGWTISGVLPATTVALNDKLKIKANAETSYQEITLNAAVGGAAVATELQTQIQALGGTYAGITVDWNITNAGQYTIKSDFKDLTSNVSFHSNFGIAPLLKLGIMNEGIERTGLTNTELSAENLKEAINLATVGITATRSGSKVTLTGTISGCYKIDNTNVNFSVITRIPTQSIPPLYAYIKEFDLIENPDPWTSSMVCKLEPDECNYGIGELAVWARIVSSNVATEAGILVMFAKSHFPIQAKNAQQIFKKRVIVAF